LNSALKLLRDEQGVSRIVFHLKFAGNKSFSLEKFNNFIFIDEVCLSLTGIPGR
jgi:hypothetical protein